MVYGYIEVYSIIRLVQGNFIGLGIVCAILYSFESNSNKYCVSANPAFQNRPIWSHQSSLTIIKQDNRNTGQHGSSHQHCPTPHIKITSEMCATLPCTSDNDCRESKTKCCFNGCIFTCKRWYQHKTPIIDWMTHGSGPRDGQDVDLQDIDYEVKSGEDLVESHIDQPFLGEICTTTVDEEGNQPLECPHGYICHVENNGHPDRGVPDSGRCMISNDVIVSSELINEYSYT